MAGFFAEESGAFFVFFGKAKFSFLAESRQEKAVKEAVNSLIFLAFLVR